ncbi:unnamed protein product [Caenorhabditis brenneri]
MNEQESVDVESAYGSQVSSNSEAWIKRDTFTMEKPTSRNQIRWKWLKHKLRGYMVLEAIFFLILVFLLITCYRISAQNQETHRMILSVQSELKSFRNPIEKDIIYMKEETEKEDLKKTKARLEEDLNGVQRKSGVKLEQRQTIINSTSKPEETYVRRIIPIITPNSTLERFNAASLIANATIDKSLSSSSSLNPLIGFDQSSLKLKTSLEEDLREHRMKSDVELDAIQSTIKSTSHSEETQGLPISPAFSTSSTLKLLNAASLIAGSRIDKSLSSSSNLNPLIGFDQSSLVLVDRPEPLADKAWCTSDEKPNPGTFQYNRNVLKEVTQSREAPIDLTDDN